MPEQFPYNLEKAQEEAAKIRELVGGKGGKEDYEAAEESIEERNKSLKKELWDCHKNISGLVKKEKLSGLSDEEKNRLDSYERKMVEIYDESPELIFDLEDVPAATESELKELQKEGLYVPQDLNLALTYYRHKLENLSFVSQVDYGYFTKEADFLKRYYQWKLEEKFVEKIKKEAGPENPEKILSYLGERKKSLMKELRQETKAAGSKVIYYPSDIRILIKDFYNPKILEIFRENPILREKVDHEKNNVLAEKFIEAEKQRFWTYSEIFLQPKLLISCD